MKKIAFLLALLMFCSTVLAQTPKQKVIVVAAGAGPKGKDGVLESLETMITNAFVDGGKFTATNRDAATLRQIDKEHIFQRSGAVDETKIKNLGKLSGADYLCAVKSTPVMESFILEARLVDIESGDILSMGNTPCDLVNVGDLVAASKEIVRKLKVSDAAAGAGGQSGGSGSGYGGGIYWDKESVRNANPIAEELIKILKQKVNTTDGTCVGGIRIAIESDKEPECAKGFAGATCTVNASLVITQCEGNKKNVLKGYLVGTDSYSTEAAAKLMMRKAENAKFWDEWVRELETRGSR